MKKILILFIIFILTVTFLCADNSDVLTVKFLTSGLGTGFFKVGFSDVIPETLDEIPLENQVSERVIAIVDAGYGELSPEEPLYLYWQIMSSEQCNVKISAQPFVSVTGDADDIDYTISFDAGDYEELKEIPSFYTGDSVPVVVYAHNPEPDISIKGVRMDVQTDDITARHRGSYESTVTVTCEGV